MRRLPFLTALTSCFLLAACVPQTTTTTAAEPVVTTLCPRLESVETRQPALISMFVKVETCEGSPVTLLSIANFTIFEDGNPISRSESRPDIFPVEQEFRTVTVLLLDLSGSVVRTGSLPVLKDAATGFVETVLAAREDIPSDVAIYWFDGAPGVTEQVAFTDDPERLLAGIAALSEDTPQDDSTNLNGAVIGGLEVLVTEQERLRASGVQFTLGSLVVFTDGTDQASRVSEADALAVVGSVGEGLLVQTVGLGAEINETVLGEIGRDGFEFAQNSAEVAAAFERAGERIRLESSSFYLVRYCSPRRAGDHSLRVELGLDAAQAAFEEDFNADSFGPGCDPADASGQLLSSSSGRVEPTPQPSPEPAAEVTPQPNAEPAEAAVRSYSFLCFDNGVDREVRYLYRWVGQDRWKGSSLAGGSERQHLWGFVPPRGSGPALELRMDTAPEGRIRYETYVLDPVVAAAPSCAGEARVAFVVNAEGGVGLFGAD